MNGKDALKLLINDLIYLYTELCHTNLKYYDIKPNFYKRIDKLKSAIEKDLKILDSIKILKEVLKND